MSSILKQTYNDVEGLKYISPKIALEEASRCLLCYDAPCSQSCPAGTDPAKFIRSIRFRNVKGAAETIRENNPLGGICARVCPYDTLCEKACSATKIEKPIRIGLLQQFAIQQEKAYGMKNLKVSDTKKNKKVACIGAGPASLTVAAELAKIGYEVSIFEKEAKAGGMLTYGIAPVRLPQEVIDYDIEQIKQLGVKFNLNTKVTKEDLDSFDAVFVGTGLWGEKLPNIEGINLQGSFSAVKFLKEFRKGNSYFVKDKNVVVIGGGDVAIDCAVTANIYGAKDVRIVYRRTLEEAPGNMREFVHAFERGISMTTNMAPVAVKGDGNVEKVEFEGFRNKTDKMTVLADIVVFATGQSSEAKELGLFSDEYINEKGLIKANNTNITGKYFAGGDAVHGAKTVVEAVKAGKKAAAYISKYLEESK